MRWGRILAGGFLAELALVIAVLPGFFLNNQTLVIWIAVIGSPVTTFLAALWVARRLDSRFVLHGALAGAVAMLIYLALLAAAGQIQAQPPIYWLAHGLKILGGAAGGAVAAGRPARTSLTKEGV
jgi:putative membrane protein (TIGR04086 family)